MVDRYSRPGRFPPTSKPRCHAGLFFAQAIRIPSQQSPRLPVQPYHSPESSRYASRISNPGRGKQQRDYFATVVEARRAVFLCLVAHTD